MRRHWPCRADTDARSYTRLQHIERGKCTTATLEATAVELAQAAHYFQRLMKLPPDVMKRRHIKLERLQSHIQFCAKKLPEVKAALAAAQGEDAVRQA
jgi:hypothetical protein